MKRQFALTYVLLAAALVGCGGCGGCSGKPRLNGAGSTFVLEQEETLRIADRLGVFLIAVDLPWMDSTHG